MTNPTGYTPLDFGTTVEDTLIPDGPEGSDDVNLKLVNEQEVTPSIKKVCSGQSKEGRMETL